MTEKLRHGGDLSAASVTYDIPVSGWLDLSTGINPLPYPIPELPPEAWRRLPIQEDLEALKSAARAYYKVQETADVVCAPGTQAIIQWLPYLRPPGSVAIAGPTYAEHAHCWRVAGHSVSISSDILNEKADVIVVVNPNNPDGRRFAKSDLIALAETQSARGGMLILDEAFADVAPERSLADAADRPGLVILKSIGKFFGLAGLRLGFAIGGRQTLTKLEAALGPWAVSGPAMHIGAQALSDTTWQSQTRNRLNSDSRRLDELLVRAGMDVIGGTTLFRLAQTARAASMAKRLASAGVLVRTFDDAPMWLRFGVPGSEADWRRLENALPPDD